MRRNAQRVVGCWYTSTSKCSHNDPRIRAIIRIVKDGPVTQAVQARPRKRQVRGQRRIELLLDVAAQVFAEVGFEAATTNAIAARAGISPGSLYQFFANKDAIAEALTKRFAERLRETQAIFGPEIEYLPLDELIDHVIDPLVAFHISHPGFQAVFSGSIVSPRLAAATQDFLHAVVRRTETVFAVRAPHLSRERRARCARVSVELVRSLLPLVVASDPAERDAIVAELKLVQRGYLAPIFEAGSDGPNAARRSNRVARRSM
jgi:AcrR family transcriptional regulator